MQGLTRLCDFFINLFLVLIWLTLFSLYTYLIDSLFLPLGQFVFLLRTPTKYSGECPLHISKCYICLLISAHGLWEWLMILSLFARLTYANVLHCIVRHYYYGFLVKEGIGLILVIQTFYTSALSVLYSKDGCPTFSVYDPLHFLLL